MSAGVVLSVELASSGSELLTFEWDSSEGEVDIRRDGDLLMTCTLDDVNELIGALRVFSDHYEAQSEDEE